jgi:hypothetical protein
MSLDLRDLRTKITPEAEIALEVEAAITGRDKSEIVRELVQEWAERRIHAATVLADRLRREGHNGEVQGGAGHCAAACGR